MKFLILLCSLSLYGGAVLAQNLNVVSTFPADGAIAVDTDSIVITFNQKVNFDPTFTQDSNFSFFIGPEDSIEIMGASLSNDSLSVILYGNLTPNTDYVALVEYADGINGEVLETPYVFQFTTSPTRGQFVVEGYLTKEVLDKQLSSLEGNDVIVYLSYKPIDVGIGDDECFDEECDGDGDAEPVYAAFADPTTGFYSIPSVREGTYFPIGVEITSEDVEFQEDFFPEIYWYDPNDNFEPDSIIVNSNTAPNDTLSGITLNLLKLKPITFKEALLIASDVIDKLPNNPIISGGGTSYAAFDENNGEPKLKSAFLRDIQTTTRFSVKNSKQASYLEVENDEIIDILNTPTGLQIQWQIYGYDAVKDSVFTINVSPFGAEFNQYFSKEDAELPEGIEFTSMKPLPESFIDSDEAASIIEAEGGFSFRSQFIGAEGFWNMNLEALHSYWDYEPDPTPNAPVMWRAEYSGFAFNPETSEFIEGYLLILLNIETGEVIYTDSEGGSFDPTSRITFDDALEIADSLLNELPNDPIVVGGATYYESDQIVFKENLKKTPKEYFEKTKAKLDDDPFSVQPDGYAYSWEIYAYDAVKDSALAIYVTEFDVEFAGYMGGESDNGEPIELDQIKPLPENYISSDSAAYLIDIEGGLAFRTMLAESEFDWQWQMELQLLHQYWDYPPNATPTAPITWSGKYYASAYDEVSLEYVEDSLAIYLDVETGEVLFSTVVVSNDVEQDVPEKFSLSQNYPNPFNPSTNITFQLSEASKVEISVYSILGQKVATIINGPYPLGSHTVQWNAQNLASGVYIYRMQAGSFIQTRKLILLK